MTATTPTSVSTTPSSDNVGDPTKDMVTRENVALACVDSEDGPPMMTSSTTMRVDTDDESPVQTVPTTRPMHRYDQSWYASPRDLPPCVVPPRPPNVQTMHNPLLGGAITMPCLANKDRVARLHHISHHNIAGLASLVYHGDDKGIPELTLSFIHACGYQSFSTNVADDVLPCYRSIQFLHKKVQKSWYNPQTLQSSPSVKRILKRGLAVIPKLSKGMAKDAVAFYKWLQQILTVYLIPLMPFDTICLSNNYQGLSPPGLGTEVYAECCVAVQELLPHLLPTSNREI